MHCCLNFLDHGLSVIFEGVANLLNKKYDSVGFTSYNFEADLIQQLIHADIMVSVSTHYVSQEGQEQMLRMYSYNLTRKNG